MIPITPGKPVFNVPAVKAAISTAMSAIAQDIRTDLDANTNGWNVPPKWIILGRLDQRDIMTADLIYRFQDKGTKAHVIMPKSARRLVFQVPGDTVFATKVNHPGTKAQNYTVDVAKVWQAKVAQSMYSYIVGALR